jgi:hypothetical protein
MLNRIVNLALAVLALATAAQAQQLAGTYYFPDKPFPQYANLWQEGWSFKDDSGHKLIYGKADMPLGGYVFIYYKNTTSKPITVNDLAIDGVKMSEALGQEAYPERAEDKFRASVLISKLPKDQIDKVMVAGWPAWWKPEPKTVEPGACGSVIIRLHRNPQPSELSITVIGDNAELAAKVATTKTQPQFGTIAFSPDLTTVYLYSRSPEPGSAPTKIFLDSKDVTSSAVISSDKSLGTSAIVLKLAKPLKLMSYHDFRAVYPDGSAAQAGIRAWGHEMVYGMWSSPGGGDDPKKATESFITEYVHHNINAVMPYVVGKCADYFNSEAGWDYAAKMGVERMVHWPGARDALFLFAMDEPDANDASWGQVEPQNRLGAYGQWLVNWTRVLQKSGGYASPVLLNIDNTYKPENWYMYHQIPDIPCVDPYTPEIQDLVAIDNPYHYGAHVRPTYVQAVTAISQSSGQPKPLHVILCSTRYRGRYPTPEEKRMEVYYAIGSGAKGLSYWWFARDSFCHGLDERTPEANALWKEIGILGAEVRTASTLITTSCPVDLPTQASDYLWVKPLLCGGDTVALAIVNENIASDRMGTMVKPCQDAQVTVTLPSWIDPKTVIEVTSDGIREVASKVDGGRLKLDLGAVDVSRFVLITSDATLKSRLQKQYNEKFAENVKGLKAGS